MSKFQIIPDTGSISDSRIVNFKLDTLIGSDDIVKIENATHGNSVTIDGSTLNLNIPESSSHSAVSIYVTIERMQEDGTYHPSEIHSAIFNIVNEKSEFKNGKVLVFPAFIGTEEESKIFVKYKPKSRVIASINDKQYSILTNDNGDGSISFFANDVLDKKSKVIQKFPIEIYSEEDSFSSKKFGGAYVNIMSDKISMYASCDPFSPTSQCQQAISGEEVGSLETRLPRGTDSLPTVNIPLAKSSSECNNINVMNGSLSLCRINSFDNVVLQNGIIVTALVSQDSSQEETQNRIFLLSDKSSLSSGSISQSPNSRRYAIVIPNEAPGQFNIIVDTDTYNRAEVGFQVLLLNDIFDNSSYIISEKTPPSTDRDGYKLVLEGGPEINEWLVCVPITVINPNCEPSINIVGIGTLPYITDVFGNTASAVNVSVASDSSSVNSYAYIYLIAEAMVFNVSQLFLYSIKVELECGVASSPVEVYGWRQLTLNGENKNPRTTVDRSGNLHVFWDSDRSGSSQVFYGVLGPGAVSAGNAALSVSLDKQSKALENIDSSWNVVTDSMVSNLDTPSPININMAEDQVYDSKVWVKYLSNNGSATIDTSSPDIAGDIRITGRPTEDQSLALAVVKRDGSGNDIDGNFSQFSYEINFDLLDNLERDILSDVDINIAYEDWESQFEKEKLNSFKGKSIFTKSDNKYIISREDRFFDKIIPIVGSYKKADAEQNIHDGVDEVNEIFEIEFSGDNRNVNHYMIGLLPEKVRFKATNIQTFEQFCESRGVPVTDTDAIANYQYDISEVIYTGNYTLASLLACKNDYYGSPKSETFCIVRKIGKPFDLNSESNFKLIVHYAKMFDEDTRSWLGVSQGDDTFSETRFMASLWLMRNNSPAYAESFVVDLSDKYRKFDIGFGFPGGGGFNTLNFLPYETSIYDHLDVDFNFNNIVIGSPSFTFDRNVVSVPKYVHSEAASIEASAGSESVSPLFADSYNYLSFGLDSNGVGLPQIPLTFEGINQHVNIDMGKVCDDLHIVWQSNKNRFWDIVYSSSISRVLPFRYDTYITATESDSLNPSIAINSFGSRVVTWHENKDGKFQIYAAKGESSSEICRLTGNGAFGNLGGGRGDDCPLLIPDITFVATDDPYDPYSSNPYPCGIPAECQIIFELCNGTCVPVYNTSLLYTDNMEFQIFE